MSDTVVQQRPGLLRIAGRIERLVKRRGEDNFVLTQTDQVQMGLVAIAAGLVGASGQAISTAASAGDVGEAADHLDLEIGGTRVSGWVWRSPFKLGDEVEAAAYWDGAQLYLQGLRRRSDGLVALYPHCSRGRRGHARNALKWWLLALAFFVLVVAIFFGFAVSSKPPESAKQIDDLVAAVAWAVAGWAAFFAAMIFSLSRKWMPFVHVAENVFRTLGWPNPESIDLVKSSKRLRQGNEPAEYGAFYFRYFPEDEAKHQRSS